MAKPYLKAVIRGVNTSAHRKVMEEIVGRPLETLEYVHHIDDIGIHNAGENLQIMSPKEHSVFHNQKHPTVKTCEVCGTEYEPKPTKRARSKSCSRTCANVLIAAARTKLTEDQKAELRGKYGPGVTQDALAAEYGISQAQVWAILNGRDRRHGSREK